MHVLQELLRRLGALLGLVMFGLTLGMSLQAGVDPFEALVRSCEFTAALLVVYFGYCRVVIPLLGATDRSD